MDNDNVTHFVTDADFAADVKERTRAALDQVHALINEATARGLMLNFQLGRDQFGRSVTVVVMVTREL